MKGKQNRSIILLSGGLDSAACVAMFKKERNQPEGLFIDYGHPAAKVEKKTAKKIAQYFEIPFAVTSCLGRRQKMSGEIFGRNLLLVAIAAFQYGSSKEGVTIVSGIHAGTPYLDCTEHFVEHISKVLRYLSQDRVQFIAPFKKWNKQQVYQYAIRHHVPTKLTYSCERGTLKGCGKCLSCLDRIALKC